MLNILATFLMLIIMFSGLISSALGHTWVEEIRLLNPNAIGIQEATVSSEGFLILKFAEHCL